MKIKLKNITLRELVEGYTDRQEEGVRGYGGKLDIRPAYQREFVYGEKQRNEVIHTIRRNFPLNTMYWAVSDEDAFELMEGVVKVRTGDRRSRYRLGPVMIGEPNSTFPSIQVHGGEQGGESV